MPKSARAGTDSASSKPIRPNSSIRGFHCRGRLSKNEERNIVRVYVYLKFCNGEEMDGLPSRFRPSIPQISADLQPCSNTAWTVEVMSSDNDDSNVDE